MPGSSQDTSFIPKHNNSRRKRTTRGGNIVILTIVSYVVFFSTLVASAGVFFYDRYVTGQFEAEVAAMNNEVASFKEADMERVLQFDARLRKAQDRVAHSVSIASLFDALEAATIGSVRFDSFSLLRNADNGFVIAADIQTTSFDSSLFQRGVFERNDIINAIEIEDLTVADQSTDSGLVTKSVSFVANLAVPIDAIPYRPATTGLTPTVVETPTVPDATQSEEVGTTTEVGTEDLIDEAVVTEPTP